ncbi:MAG: TetR/AcrR family transcriptional regulator [Pseudomonadota bacterium]
MNQVSYSLEGKSPKTARGAKTKAKLLEAAALEFGERGYHACMIADITRRAKVGMGTFYVYFDSKEEVFRELVAYMSNLTRTHISKTIEGITDRLEAERAGIVAYLNFAREHKDLYRIVMESQFVAEDAYRNHYRVFHSAYTNNLEFATRKGQIRQGDNEVRAWALIGISVFLGMGIGLDDEKFDVNRIADAAFDMIKYGLNPDANIEPASGSNSSE